MQAEFNQNKKSITVNENLQKLGESFTEFLNEPNTRPPNTRYLCSLRTDGQMNPIQLSWGWAEKDNNTGFSLKELQEIKYENNLETIVDYPDPVTMDINFIFPCLECIRRGVGPENKIYFVTGQTCTFVFL